MRIDASEQAPAVHRSLIRTSALMKEYASDAGLKATTLELIALRASQLNACAFCLDLHWRDALAAGESPRRLALLPAWREATDVFTPQERAALALTEAITHISTGQVPDEVCAAAAEVLDDAQMAAVTWAATLINAFNRVATTSRFAVPADDRSTDAPLTTG